jgi:hypothetical protein
VVAGRPPTPTWRTCPAVEGGHSERVGEALQRLEHGELVDASADAAAALNANDEAQAALRALRALLFSSVPVGVVS